MNHPPRPEPTNRYGTSAACSRLRLLLPQPARRRRRRHPIAAPLRLGPRRNRHPPGGHLAAARRRVHRRGPSRCRAASPPPGSGTGSPSTPTCYSWPIPTPTPARSPGRAASKRWSCSTPTTTVATGRLRHLPRHWRVHAARTGPTRTTRPAPASPCGTRAGATGGPTWRRTPGSRSHRCTDDGRPVPGMFDTVFACRSGGWVPAWCDDQWQQFIDTFPGQVAQRRPRPADPLAPPRTGGHRARSGPP